MGIGVQGDADPGVAETFLDNLWMYALSEHEGRVCVARIVETVPIQSCPTHDKSKRAAEASREDGGAVAMTKREAISVDSVPQRTPVRLMAVPQGPQHQD